jgi:hypothetical protein
MTLCAIELAPQEAAVGIEIKVCCSGSIVFST